MDSFDQHKMHECCRASVIDPGSLAQCLDSMHHVVTLWHVTCKLRGSTYMECLFQETQTVKQ